MLRLKSIPTGSEAILGSTSFGAYGDAFGALNTLFAGLAFSGILVSIFLQSKELSETREELRGQKNQMRRQGFENTFFQILHSLSSAVDTTYYKTQTLNRDLIPSSTQYEGRECINFLLGIFKTKYLDNKSKGSNYLEQYEKFYEEMGNKSLGHYYRLLYSIVKYVHKSDFLDLEEVEGLPKREFYINLIRAQISSDELFFIFYNCLSTYGKDKFKPMIEKYSFFEHLQEQRYLVDHWVLKYHENAYGNSEDWIIRLGKIRDEKKTP